MTTRTTPGAKGATRARKGATAVQPTPTLPASLIEKLADTDRYAVEQLADFSGPSVFNPLIGATPDETFDKLEIALGAMSAIIENGDNIDSTQLCRGLQVMTDVMWAAAQYEAFRVNHAKKCGAA